MLFRGLVDRKMLLFPDTINIKEALCKFTSAIANVMLDPVCTFLAVTLDAKGAAKNQQWHCCNANRAAIKLSVQIATCALCSEYPFLPSHMLDFPWHSDTAHMRGQCSFLFGEQGLNSGAPQGKSPSETQTNLGSARGTAYRMEKAPFVLTCLVIKQEYNASRNVMHE
eukprot:1161182-Pelagomonas_calceolata.AAC.2